MKEEFLCLKFSFKRSFNFVRNTFSGYLPRSSWLKYNWRSNFLFTRSQMFLLAVTLSVPLIVLSNTKSHHWTYYFESFLRITHLYYFVKIHHKHCDNQPRHGVKSHKIPCLINVKYLRYLCYYRDNTSVDNSTDNKL